MVVIKEFIILFQIAQIPAEVEVVAVDIRDLQDRTVCFQHEYIGHGGRTGGIHMMAEIIQKTVVFQQVFVDGTGCGDLIGQSPYNDGWMVVALSDQFTHCLQGVFTPVGHMHGDIGDLCPDGDAVFVTEIVEFLGMLVVGKAQCVGTELFDDLHVFAMIRHVQSIAFAFSVLVSGYATQRIAFSIEQEAFFRITFIIPAAKTGTDSIAGSQSCLCCIEIRVIYTVP